MLIYKGNLEEKELLHILKDKIPDYMIPKKAIQMDHIPLNANGKIDRVKLKEYVGR